MAFIASDCSATVILTTRSYKLTALLKISQTPLTSKTEKFLKKLDWISTDDISNSRKQDFVEKHSEILFLQYTSGSTNDPKGVIVTHENLIDNCKSIKLIKKDKKLINQIPKEIKKTESPRILENEENINFPHF